MQKLMRNKGKKFEWNDEAEVAFEKIKRELCEAPVLGMPTEKGTYVLETDPSQEYCIRSKNGMEKRFSVPLQTAAKS